MRDSQRKILVSLSMASAAGRRQLSGIYRYIARRRPWDIILFRQEEMCEPAIIRAVLREGPSGIISSSTPSSPKVGKAIARARIPFVAIDFNDDCPFFDLSIPHSRVNSDDFRAGTEGARHLLSLGSMRSFGYIPWKCPTRQWSRLRQAGLAQMLRGKGLSLQVFDRRMTTLVKWLQELPKPAAVMGASDNLAVDVLTICHREKIKVPEQLVLLGTDNDELICENAAPRLSSVQIDHEGEGFAAAKALDRLMRSPKKPVRPVLIAPGGVIVRESTKPVAPAANLIDRALRYIRENACAELTVNGVAAHLGVSRRLLYLRFSELVGKSVLKTITETRVALLKDRLRISKEPVARLSLKCGFKTAKNAKRVFKAATGLSMREWRNRNTV